MVNRGCIVAVVGLLANVGIAVADTQVQLLTKVFDAAYLAAFPERKNMFHSSEVYTAPLIEAMNSIEAYVHKNSSKFDSAVSSLKNATDRLIDALAHIANSYHKPIVMLSFTEWKEIFKDIIDNKWSDAVIKEISAARDLINRIKSRDVETKDLLDHVSLQLVKALSRIQNDARQARVLEFSKAQAETKASRIVIINGISANDQMKWSQIMNIIGLDDSVTEKNVQLALKKFGIEPYKTELQFADKDEISRILHMLYDKLSRR